MNAKLTILGSGTCVSSYHRPFDFRHPPGYLLEYEGKRILLDCSEGIRARLAKIKVDYFTIDAIFISHFHPDHFNLTSFIQSLMVRAQYVHKKKSIAVFGPPHLQKAFATIWDMKHYKDAFEDELANILDIRFIEYNNAKPLTVADKIIATPFPVFHAEGRMDAYAVRLNLGGYIFAYSGDSGLCDGLQQACRNADYFLCEASTPIGQNKSKKEGHLTPQQAGQIAAAGRVKRLVLTHYHGGDSDTAMVADVKKGGYKNDIQIAKDFDLLQL